MGLRDPIGVSSSCGPIFSFTEEAGSQGSCCTGSVPGPRGIITTIIIVIIIIIIIIIVFKAYRECTTNRALRARVAALLGPGQSDVSPWKRPPGI